MVQQLVKHPSLPRSELHGKKLVRLLNNKFAGDGTLYASEPNPKDEYSLTFHGSSHPDPEALLRPWTEGDEPTREPGTIVTPAPVLLDQATVNRIRPYTKSSLDQSDADLALDVS